MNQERFVYVSYIKTTPERLWEALTDRSLLRRIWGCDVTVGTKPGEPFEISTDGEVSDRGVVLTYDRPRTLAYSFRYLPHEETESRVTFTLEPKGDLVKLTLIHDDFQPESRTLRSVSGGWPLILGDMKSLLEGVDVDYKAALASMEGGEVHTPLKTFIRTYIAASPERIWEALTSSDFTKVYFFGRTVHSDWQVGSPVEFRTEDGKLDVSGVVLKSEPPRLLSYTWKVEWIPEFKNLPDCWVAFEIEPYGNVSRLTLSEFHAEPLDEKLLEGGRQGWPVIFSGLKTLLETGEPLGLVEMSPPKLD